MRYKVEFEVISYPSFKTCTNWAWLKKDGIKDLFAPYAKVVNIKIRKKQGQEK